MIKIGRKTSLQKYIEEQSENKNFTIPLIKGLVTGQFFLVNRKKINKDKKELEELRKFKKLFEEDKIKLKLKRKPITKSIRHEILKRDQYKCVECGVTKDETTLHIDHIKPISQGGTDEMSNLRVLCKICNMSKSNRNW